MFPQPRMPTADRGGNPLAPNLTGRDLSSHLGSVSGAGGLYIQFFYLQVRIQSADPALNGKFQTRLCVAKVPRGDRYTVSTRFISEERAAAEFPQEFAAFKTYQSVPTAGTPLQELPGISQSQIAYLTIYNVRSIEDLAALQDHQIQSIGPEARQAHALATRWLAQRNGARDIIAESELEVARSAEIAALKKRLEETERENLQLNAQVSVMNRLGVAPQVAPGQVVTAPAAPPSDAVPYSAHVNADPVYDFPVRDNDLAESDPVLISGNGDLAAADATAEDPLGLGRPARKSRG